MQASPVQEVDRALVLGQATHRAAVLLGLNGREFASVLGFSEATVSRIGKGDRGIDPASKEGELSLLLVRVFRSLDALVGGDEAQRRSWMRSLNRGLNGVPADLIKSAEGLVRTLAYLDGLRAPL